jgi:hypothetical protein
MRLRVVNQTRGTVLADRAERAGSFLARLRGLLGRRGLEPGEGLWLTPCDAIHMFFMRFAIDALFLDGQSRVVRIYPSLPPWAVTRRERAARSVLELPAGAAALTRTEPGDQLCLEVKVDPTVF